MGAFAPGLVVGGFISYGTTPGFVVCGFITYGTTPGSRSGLLLFSSFPFHVLGAGALVRVGHGN